MYISRTDIEGFGRFETMRKSDSPSIRNIVFAYTDVLYIAQMVCDAFYDGIIQATVVYP